MYDQGVLGVQIHSESLHFQNLGYVSTVQSPVVENRVAISIHSFEIKLAEQDSKRGLTNLVLIQLSSI